MMESIQVYKINSLNCLYKLQHLPTYVFTSENIITDLPIQNLFV